jgi:hypothetical protein
MSWFPGIRELSRSAALLIFCSGLISAQPPSEPLANFPQDAQGNQLLFGGPHLAPATRDILLLDSLQAVEISPASIEYRIPLGAYLESPTPEVRIAACELIHAWEVPWFDERLLETGAHCCTPTTVRIAALKAVMTRAEKVDPPSFLVLKSQLYEQVPIHLREQGAEILSRAPLTESQILALLEEIGSDNPLKAGPAIWPRLFPLFERHPTLEVGKALVEAAKKSPGLDAVPEEAYLRAMANYPLEIVEQLDSLKQAASSGGTVAP